MTYQQPYVIIFKVMRERYIHTGCTYTQNYDEGTYTFTGPCRVTGEPYTVTIPGAELFDLNQGLHIQDALRSLDAGQREFVISGTSPKGWEKLFGNDAWLSSNCLVLFTKLWGNTKVS